MSKLFFTTGQIAKMFDVSPRVVSAWVDSGRMKGFRLPPIKGERSNGDRRIPRESVIEFSRKFNLPVKLSDCMDLCTVLCFGFGKSDFYYIKNGLALDTYDVVFVSDLFECGTLFVEKKPQILVLDVPMIGSEAFTITLRRVEEWRKTVGCIIAVFGEDEATPEERAEELGIAVWFKRPVIPQVVVDAIRCRFETTRHLNGVTNEDSWALQPKKKKKLVG